ncbi:fermentation-respiration switch protein FrsA (DUF1100 family) [Inquilinus ginsengisoli]|uniref:alpha/beta hydrolase n=1 Tax=Inquilinus ginsengisoli TaxID=363840 RepID=UPI003D232397
MNRRTVLAAGASLVSLAAVAPAGAAGAAGASANEAPITGLAEFTKTVSEDRTVSRRTVTFRNGQIDMAGVIFEPADMEKGKAYPAIVVVHPGGGSKEQTASLYAYRFAQQGYISLAYDASHQGESGGMPRLLENPTVRVEDVRSAVDYFTTLPVVDRERIAAMGICAGGAYAINATMTDHRIKAVAGVSSFNMGDGFRKGWFGSGTVEEQLATLRNVARQRTAEANGAEPAMFPYVPDSPEGVTDPEQVEVSEYYRLANRWMHANSPNRFLASSTDKIYAYDAFTNIGVLLTQPLLLIAGSDAGTKWHSDRAFAEAASAGEKELFVVPGGTHMSLYDRDVGKAMPKLLEFFGRHLDNPAI